MRIHVVIDESMERGKNKEESELIIIACDIYGQLHAQ